MRLGVGFSEMSIISCSMSLSGHRRHIITIFLVLEFGFFGGFFSSFWRFLERVRDEYKYTMYLLLRACHIFYFLVS